MRLIDSDNYAASGIETMFFPGGEPHARIPKDFGPALLFLKARTWNDVGLALVVLDALRIQGQDQEFRKVWLFAPYFPGARQDRSDKQTPGTASLMLNLFQDVTDKIFTFDAHSGMTSELVDHNFMPSDLDLAYFESEPPTIIIPDAGALKRCQDFNSVFRSGYGDLVQCEKHRDFATGKFTGFIMPKLPRAGNYLIVDDICDGGGTFNLLAQEFKKDPLAQFSRLDLWVSHGIFSKGLAAIDSTIRKIYTTDSFTPIGRYIGVNSRLQVISLAPIVSQILEEYNDV